MAKRLNHDHCASPVALTVQQCAGAAWARRSPIGLWIFAIALSAAVISSGCSGVTSAKPVSSSSSSSSSPSSVSNLVIVTKSLPSAQAGSLYTVQLVASGVAPYRWSLVSGALPPGLTLNTDGFLQGVPQQAGRFDFVVEVQDGSSSTARLEVISTIGEQA